MLHRDRRLISRRGVVALIFEWKVLLLTRCIGRSGRAIEVFPEVIKKTVRTAIQTCSTLGAYTVSIGSLNLILEGMINSPRHQLELIQRSLGMHWTSFLRCGNTNVSFRRLP
jgi:hypothetical protein